MQTSLFIYILLHTHRMPSMVFFCSGLTERTKLSFTSSNSSFNECVRKQSIRKNSYSSIPPAYNTGCSANPTEDQQFTNQSCTYTSGVHSFFHSTWDNDRYEDGGCAICIIGSSDAPSGTLEVDQCSFSHCHSSGNVGSGGVAALYISSASVSSSVFVDCSCKSANTQEGAGVLFGGISLRPLIIDCSYFTCTTWDDGGGCGIWHSHSAHAYVVEACLFIQCRGLNLTSSQGGGAVIGANSNFITCTNSLFSFCSSLYHGGGLALASQFCLPDQPLTFCFFHQNTAKYGNDIYYYYTPDPTSDILHCFSTSSPHRICYVENVDDNADPNKYEYDDANWLPKGRF